MFLTRTHPTFGSFEELRREMNRLLGGVTTGVDAARRWRGPSFPALNIWEDDERFYVEAEMPGLSMDDIGVHILGNDLTITGERQETTDEKYTYHRQERGTGTFARSIVLPTEVDPDKVEAVLNNGVLTITLPKAATVKARKITVQSE